jgi:hypothetical protein
MTSQLHTVLLSSDDKSNYILSHYSLSVNRQTSLCSSWTKIFVSAFFPLTSFLCISFISENVPRNRISQEVAKKLDRHFFNYSRSAYVCMYTHATSKCMHVHSCIHIMNATGLWVKTLYHKTRIICCLDTST